MSRSSILGSFAGVLALASALAPIATASAATTGAPATTAAAAATVSVRAESLTRELVATTLTTTTKAVVKDGDAQHGCSGTSAAGALQQATGGSWTATWFSGLGYSVAAIDGVKPAGTDYWTLWLNGRASQTGLCDTQLQRGDDVLLFVCHDAAAPDYACKNRPLALVAPKSKQLRAGKRVAVRVVTLKDDGSAVAAAGATVRGAGAPVTAGADGVAKVVLAAGQSALQATRAGDVRSAVLHCTAATGSGACGGSDRTAPAIAVKGIRNGQTFAAKDAPRTLHGTATDPSGASVQLRLVRSVGSSCSYFDARREAFRRCGSVRAPLFSAGDRSHWSYLLPQRLPAGRYVLGVKATDKAGNADSLRLRFDVAAPRAAATAAASAPRVETMVVGTAGTLLAARTVTASAASVTVGRRSCAVAAGTPLAVLLAARRAGGPGLAVVDQGACSRNPRDAYGLFVTRIGSERNRGQAGWVYKVGRRGGTAGAGDASGPFGAGPLASGSRVLWFYCRVASRCQSSLEATAPRSARPGAPVVVHVRAYDDNGRGRAIAGVAVHFGDTQVATGSDGIARFTAPQRPGRFVLSATRPGLVPAFPSEVAVR